VRDRDRSRPRGGARVRRELQDVALPRLEVAQAFRLLPDHGIQPAKLVLHVVVGRDGRHAELRAAPTPQRGRDSRRFEAVGPQVDDLVSVFYRELLQELFEI